MLKAKCPKCGKDYYGWALRQPEQLTCTECGARLEVANDDAAASRDKKKTMMGQENKHAASRCCRWQHILIITALLILTILIGCSNANQAEQDKIVVECAEQILWDYSYIYTPEWGFKSCEDSHKAFLIDLALDDIFLFEDKHPFLENDSFIAEKGFDSYIAFKANYYRRWFDWGRLPPKEIIERAGLSEES